jgi:RNA-binding protein YhbY
MEKIAIGKLQLGKQGVTDNFIYTIKNMFKTHKNVKISVLKSARGEGKQGKIKVKAIADELLEKLGRKYTAKIIGFTIVVKKWRKPKR